MHRIRTTTAAILSTAALSIVGAPVAAQTTTPDQEPCAKETTQVSKAQEALDRVTAVFAKQQERVADAREDVKHADSRSDRAEAIAALHAAKEKKTHVAEAKKAQQMRLAKAQERLATCEAGGTTAS
jgi:hypothetical protein